MDDHCLLGPEAFQYLATSMTCPSPASLNGYTGSNIKIFMVRIHSIYAFLSMVDADSS
jgi:hypothetical protein